MPHPRTIAVALALAVAAASGVDVAEARPRPKKAKRFTANKGFGLGLMVGAPTGLSGKYFYARDKAFDFGVGAIRYYRERDGLHLHVDHLWHPVSLLSDRAFELPVYLGLGVRVFDFDDDREDHGLAVGARAPLGIAFDFNNVPLDLFVELALVVDLFVDYGDRYGADVNGAVGLRYYFN